LQSTFGEVAEWSNALVLKNQRTAMYRGFESLPLRTNLVRLSYKVLFLNKMMKLLFRVVALLEGISYILLMTVGLYFKYILNDDSYVKLLGMPHGILFVLYILIAILLNNKENWNIKDLTLILLASLIPCGTFYVDRKYLLK
tara:strand:+ start:935 stop:1360 length:426 start_codon:yes stop_codon:yes gene_type:complete